MVGCDDVTLRYLCDAQKVSAHQEQRQTHSNTLLLAPFCRKHDAEQQDRDYLQLHNRTTLLLTNLITT